MNEKSLVGWISTVAGGGGEKRRKRWLMGGTCVYSTGRSMLSEVPAHHPDG